MKRPLKLCSPPPDGILVFCRELKILFTVFHFEQIYERRENHGQIYFSGSIQDKRD